MKLSNFTGIHIKNFWKNVTLAKVRGGCWLWGGSVSGHGYGVLSIKSNKQFVHRISFFIHNGFLPKKDMMVCHRCHNKLCVNPDHLYEGTNKQNQLDRSIKEQLETISVKNTTQKKLDKILKRRTRLTKEKAEQIRKLYTTGNYSQRKLAQLFNCAQNTISNVLSGTSWK